MWALKKSWKTIWDQTIQYPHIPDRNLHSSRHVHTLPYVGGKGDDTALGYTGERYI